MPHYLSLRVGPRLDGPINLYNAVLLAGSKEAVGKGVLVTLNDQINAGREVTKTNTSTMDTFKTPELGFLGYIQGSKPYFYRQSTRKNTADTPFDIMNLDKSLKLTKRKGGEAAATSVEEASKGIRKKKKVKHAKKSQKIVKF